MQHQDETVTAQAAQPRSMPSAPDNAFSSVNPLIDTVAIPVIRPIPRSPARPLYVTPAALAPQSRAVLRRESAPLLLRVLVFALVPVFLVAMGGVVLIHLRPSSLASLRASPPAAPARTPASTRPAGVAHIRLISSSTTAATYRVPVGKYALVLSCDNPCWTKISSPAGGATAFESTLSPASGPKTVDVVGSSSIMVAAQAVSLTVVSGAHRLGTIAAPVVGYTYVFDPAKT